MHDQLAGWVGDIIGGVGLLLGILKLRRYRRKIRYRHFKGFGVERTRLDVDDHQL
jgi:hypothetical protein